MHILLLFASIFFSYQVLADGSVRFADLVEDLNNAESLIQVNNGGADYFLATYEKPAGDGTSSSAPALTWIPVRNGAGQENHVTVSNPAAVVPNISAGTGGFRTYLKITNGTGSTRYLYAAVRDPDNTSSYLVVSGVLGTFASQSSTYLYWAPVSVPAICANINCDKIEGSASDNSAKEEALVYFFLSPISNLGSGTDITPSDNNYNGGSYLRVYLSSRLQNSDLDLQELRRGDGRLRAIFSGTTINDHYRTLAVVNGQGNALSAGPVQTALTTGGSQLLDLDTKVTSGELNIRPLINNVCYEVVVLFEDKYKLATETSDSLNGCPAQIEALLEKQACYILSAGFQEKHFITEFFRAFRDKLLLQTTIGTSFVDWYYRTAPHYAPFIYSSPILAFTVRCLAYMLWFLMNLCLLAIPLLFFLALLNRLSGAQRWRKTQ